MENDLATQLRAEKDIASRPDLILRLVDLIFLLSDLKPIPS